MNFVVLSSSHGTTFQAILDRIADGSLKAKYVGLVTDRADRGCIEKARAAGLPFVAVERKKNEEREEHDRRLHEAIIALASSERETNKRVNESPNPSVTSSEESRRPLIACIGWMFIFSPWFIRAWHNRILNVHPALLPRYSGAGMHGMKVHETVLAAGERESGMTIHLMDEGVDTGRILLQKTCPVFPGDTPETLKVRVQALEKEWYPKVLQMIEEGKLSLEP